MAWYILDENNKPVKSTGAQEYLDWEEANQDKKYLKQEFVDDIHVSTVFLGLDHSWNSNIPVLWETMIFGGEHDQYQDRYTSVEDALEGHQKALNLVNKQ